ncbi:Fe2+-dependent dioxygenase [Phenylobacterium sp.]|jgi:PKHD-type hydroxylase|uniref:Fe2+-dependent dioxygenase n=1 Tax=Phenylobacterium sp. TaxID=1871053 RepID=UPI002E334186|nr:Fe2+-dependent dioxygenase [Phenylobacterium sp.]HEX2558915.1 Fe2+-dependent dioxygenase [Phenylobacterium sp.]
MLTLAGVLESEDLTRIREALAEAPWLDGRRTAGPAARKVKANTQADTDNPKIAALGRFVREALERSEVFAAYARPARWSTLMFNRYGPGETYGTHMDDALMGPDGGKLRTDLSFTLFLSEPEAYEGGELVVEGLEGERAVKLAAGSLVVYSTGALHRVEPVTSGERLACVGWIQSFIRRADEREVLFDLARVRAALPEGEARLLLDKASGNLLRLWGEP